MAKSSISTRKKVGCSITIAMAAFLIIFAFCGRYFNSTLKSVANFFVGSFGMAFYGMMIALICVCSFVLAGKTIRIPAKYVTHFILLFVEIVMLVHMFSTIFVYDNCSSFAQYASYVYNYYSGVPTFGGIVFGSVVYGLQSVVTIFAAAFLLFGLLAWSVIVTGDFFYSYFTGKLSLSQKHKEEITLPEVTTTQNKEPVHEVEDERTRALKILFSPDEHSLNTEEVGSAEVFGSAQQSKLDTRSTTHTKEEAESILFNGAGTDFYNPSVQTVNQSNNGSDEIGLNGFFTPTTQPKVNDESSWRVTKSETSRTETKVEEVKPVVEEVVKEKEVKTPTKKREMPKGEWVIPVVEDKSSVDIVDVVADDIDDATTSNQTLGDQDVSKTTSIAQAPTTKAKKIEKDSVVVTKQSVKNNTTEEEQVVQQQSDLTDDVQDDVILDDSDEMVAIEKNKIVPGGVQMGFDFATKAEVREAEQSVHQYAEYVNPPVELLEEAEAVEDNDAEYRNRASQAIVNKLAVFGIKIELVDQIVGPTVTQYRFNVLSEKTRMSDFLRYSNDLKACLEAKAEIRVEAPIMGTNLVGIEAPNKVRTKVALRNLLESKEVSEKRGALVFPIGQEISGQIIVGDLAKLPHLLVAGTTGSGKSVFLHSLIVSLIYRYGPEYLRFVMVDPKFVELSRYNGIPHMLTTEAITTPGDALGAMDYLINEMESRYLLFKEANVANIIDYNAKVNPKLVQRLPYLVLIVDELADLMSACGKNFEAKLQRLAAKARAAGIHMILATQRPDVRTITGTIKANLPSRIALKVSTPTDSITILSSGGADKLLGNGDMLYMNSSNAGFTRAQGAYVDDEEIRAFVDFVSSQNEVYFDEKISQEIFVSRQQPVETDTSAEKNSDDSEEKLDPYCKKALRFWLERQGGRASIASIQRALKIGFNRAGRIMDSLQKLHYVEEIAASESGSKPVRVLVTLEELDELFPDMED